MMSNALASQGMAVARNAAAAVKDPTVRRHEEWPVHYPTSAYAFVRGKPFREYAAEQIANQVEKRLEPIVAHVRAVLAGAVDGDNITSLTIGKIDDRREPGVEI